MLNGQTGSDRLYQINNMKVESHDAEPVFVIVNLARSKISYIARYFLYIWTEPMPEGVSDVPFRGDRARPGFQARHIMP